jgi:hypothetical protein
VQTALWQTVHLRQGDGYGVAATAVARRARHQKTRAQTALMESSKIWLYRIPYANVHSEHF